MDKQTINKFFRDSEAYICIIIFAPLFLITILVFGDLISVQGNAEKDNFRKGEFRIVETSNETKELNT